MANLRFSGRLTISPPLTAGQLAELDAARTVAPGGDQGCPWEVSADGDCVRLHGGGRFITPQVTELERLIRDFFGPWGCLLSGELRWADGGEARDESGAVYVDRNRVECVWDVLVNGGPSWAAEPRRRVGDRYEPLDPAAGRS